MTGSKSDALLARMMTLHPKIIDLTLDRVCRLLAATGHPERSLPTLTPRHIWSAFMNAFVLPERLLTKTSFLAF